MADVYGYQHGQQTVDLSVLVRRTAEASFAAFKQLCEDCPDQSDSERKIALLKFITKTRQRLLRLLVLSKWCCQIPLVECCQQLVGTLSNHDTSFTQAADSLFYLHEGLQQARSPLYDIASALEVLLSGSYQRLPKCIEDLGMQPALIGKERESTLQKLDTLLRSRLLDISIPKELSTIAVSNGRVKLCVEGEFEVDITLGYRGNPSLWRVLHLELLVGERTGKTKLTDIQRGALGDDLERRMAAVDNPFETLYSVLHEFCTALVMDTVIRQVLALKQGRWKDAIRFEIVTDGSNPQAGIGSQTTGQTQVAAPDGDTEISIGKFHISPSLKIMYWLDLYKSADSNLFPSLRIEPGPDHHIICSHQPSIIDSATNNEAEFVLEQSCIDVEKLLLWAISCNIHTRLLEIQSGLKSSSQLCRSESDVLLKIPHMDGTRQAHCKSDTLTNEGILMISTGEDGEEILCVRAYGQSYMALSINIRNGRLMLRFPNHLLDSTILIEMEEALNQGLASPLEVFVSLRIKCLLHLFASIGTSLKLEIYEKGAVALKFPSENLKLGADVLVMGFPNCGNAYFLLVQLDNNFMPIFTLLEGQTHLAVGQSVVLVGPVQVARFIKLNIESFMVSEDEINISLLDEGSLEFQTGVSISSLDSPGKEGFLGVMELGGGKGTDVRVESMHEFGSPAEKLIAIDKGGLYSGQLYKQSNALHSSPLSLQATRQGIQLGLVNQTMHSNALLFQNNSEGKASPGTSSISGRFMSEANMRNVRQSFMGGMPLALGSSGSVVSPSRNSSFQKLTSGAKSLYQPELDPLLSKSPVNLGDSAASPINLDDDDLSKLIDSISSKTVAIPPGSSNSLDDGISLPASSCRQARTSTPVRSSSFQRSSLPSVKSPISKSSLLQTNYIVRNPGQSPTASARTASPAKRSPAPDSLNGRTDSASNMSESSEMGETFQSASVLLSPRPAVGLAPGQPLLISSPQSNVAAEKLQQDSSKHKRLSSDLLHSLPSLQGLLGSLGSLKRRKIDSEVNQICIGNTVVQPIGTPSFLEYFVGQSYGSIVAAANQGKAPVCSYTAVLLQVVRRSLLCIKHACLTSQMDSLGIPYVEEVGLRRPSTNLWFRLPAMKASRELRSKSQCGWDQICLCLGRLGSAGWEVKIRDDHFKGLWELQRQKNVTQWGGGVQVVTSEVDSHIRCTPEGLVLIYEFVEVDSIKRLLADLERLLNARTFSLGIKGLLESKMDEKEDMVHEKMLRLQSKGTLSERVEGGEKTWEVIRKAFRIEAVGLTSVWFSYVGSLPGVIARFVVEWETRKKGCTMHVSPEQLWPHTKYLEDYINGGEVELLLDCIRVTAGPLHALAGAIRPARMPMAAASVSTGGSGAAIPSKVSMGGLMLGQVLSPNATAVTSPGNSGRALLASGNAVSAVNSSLPTSQTGPIVSGPGRGTGLAPNSLLPTDVSVVLRSPYWIRIVYRRQFAVDMRCFAGDQVWLQPAPPPRGGGSGIKGSLPCPQFRPFVMEQITTGFNSAEPTGISTAPALSMQGGQQVSGGIGGLTSGLVQASGGNTTRVATSSIGVNRPALGVGSQAAGMLNRVGNLSSVLGPQGLVPVNALGPARGLVPGTNMGFHPSYRELSAAGYGFSDDGGYGGVWVSLAVLKRVLKGTLRYLGVVWLFAQFPSIIQEVLASNLKENEGKLLNHDPETPALRFYIQNCLFAVSVHRQQLILQAINVKRYQQPQQPQQQQQLQQSQTAGSDSDLSSVEMQEIGDFFARRAAFEPYDASRLASFVTMLTLPVPVLREFIGLIAWKKDANKASQGQVGDVTQPPRPRVELCLENRAGLNIDTCPSESGSRGSTGNGPKSSIHYNRSQNTVDFTLTVILDPANLPHINVAGGAGWLPQCVAVRLRYAFGEGTHVSLLSMEGSHGGRACWSCLEDWERCKEMVWRAVESQEPGQGRLQTVAEAIQIALQSAF